MLAFGLFLLLKMKDCHIYNSQYQGSERQEFLIMKTFLIHFKQNWRAST